MDEDVIMAMNDAADTILEGKRTKDETIALMREWLDNWEASEDD